jgi:hypothetical protein
LTEQPRDEVKEYWSSVYPGISTVVGNCAAAERAGYAVVETMTLSNKDRKAYYGPIKARIAALRAEGDVPAELSAVLNEMEQEIEFATKYAEECGYVFYLLEKQGTAAELDGDAFEAWGDELEDASAGEDAPEYEDVDDTKVRRRGRPSRGTTVCPRQFDVTVAPTNAVTYHKLEQQIVELISELGLEQAARVFGQVENRVQSVVVTGR